MSEAYRVRELTTLAEMTAQYPLVRQLNPTLTVDAYESILPDMLRHVRVPWKFCGRND